MSFLKFICVLILFSCSTSQEQPDYKYTPKNYDHYLKTKRIKRIIPGADDLCKTPMMISDTCRKMSDTYYWSLCCTHPEDME